MKSTTSKPNQTSQKPAKSIYAWEVKNDFPEADFWLQNKGSEDTLGTVIREYQPYLTGIKCSDMILPEFGFYLCEYLKQQGVWKAHAKGSLNYKHLRITDIRAVFTELGRSHQEQTRQRYKNYVPTKPRNEELSSEEKLSA